MRMMWGSRSASPDWRWPCMSYLTSRGARNQPAHHRKVSCQHIKGYGCRGLLRGCGTLRHLGSMQLASCWEILQGVRLTCARTIGFEPSIRPTTLPQSKSPPQSCKASNRRLVALNCTCSNSTYQYQHESAGRQFRAG